MYYNKAIVQYQRDFNAKKLPSQAQLRYKNNNEIEATARRILSLPFKSSEWQRCFTSARVAMVKLFDLHISRATYSKSKRHHNTWASICAMFDDKQLEKGREDMLAQASQGGKTNGYFNTVYCILLAQCPRCGRTHS